MDFCEKLKKFVEEFPTSEASEKKRPTFDYQGTKYQGVLLVDPDTDRNLIPDNAVLIFENTNAYYGVRSTEGLIPFEDLFNLNDPVKSDPFIFDNVCDREGFKEALLLEIEKAWPIEVQNNVECIIMTYRYDFEDNPDHIKTPKRQSMYFLPQTLLSMLERKNQYVEETMNRELKKFSAGDYAAEVLDICSKAPNQKLPDLERRILDALYAMGGNNYYMNVWYGPGDNLVEYFDMFFHIFEDSRQKMENAWNTIKSEHPNIFTSKRYESQGKLSTVDGDDNTIECFGESIPKYIDVLLSKDSSVSDYQALHYRMLPVFDERDYPDLISSVEWG